MRTYKSLEGRGDRALQMKESKVRTADLSEEWCSSNLRNGMILRLDSLGYKSPREVESIDFESKTFVGSVVTDPRKKFTYSFHRVSAVLLDGVEWKSIVKMQKLHDRLRKSR